MPDQFSRTELLLGQEAMQALARSRVAVFGIGGVGGYVCEALCRSGVGAFDLVDDDRVCLTNLNRQIIATHETVGRLKTEVMAERIHQINPNADVRVHTCFFLPENAGAFSFADGVDTAKLYSKEVEYSAENLDCLADHFAWEPQYETKRLKPLLTAFF